MIIQHRNLTSEPAVVEVGKRLEGGRKASDLEQCAGSSMLEIMEDPFINRHGGNRACSVGLSLLAVPKCDRAKLDDLETTAPTS